jgi:Methyltransferase domain
MRGLIDGALSRLGLQLIRTSEISEWQEAKAAQESLRVSLEAARQEAKAAQESMKVSLEAARQEAKAAGAAEAEVQSLRATLDQANKELGELREFAADPGKVTRQILDDIAENRLFVGGALYSAFSNIRLASQMRAATTSAEWLHKNADRTPTYARRNQMLEASFPSIPAEGDLAEFGVFTGAITRFVRPRFADRRYHAFDSWRGVPEAMGLAVNKFGFDLGGVVPKLPPDTTIHAGWFHETIPKWREQFDAPIAFAYIDCDLYESVCTVLEGLTDRILPGTILAFDDWYNFPNWEEHSLKASREWMERHGIRMEPVGVTTVEHAVAFRIVG